MHTQTTSRIAAALALAFSAALAAGCQQMKQLMDELQPVAQPQAADSQTANAKTSGSGGQTNGGVDTVKATGTTTAPPALVAPTPQSPSNGTVFNVYPRTTTVSWAPVTGAASYTVEVQYCQPPGNVRMGVMPVLCRGATPWKLMPGIQGTSATFDFVGAQPGIWRVWAVDANGTEGPKGAWWKFSYTK